MRTLLYLIAVLAYAGSALHALADDPTDALAQALRAGAADEVLKALHQDGADIALLAQRHPSLLADLHAERRATATWLLGAGFPPDLPDARGDTALYHAVRHDDLQRVQALLDAGAQPEPELLRQSLRNARLPLIRTVAEALPERHQSAPDLLSAYLGEGGQNTAMVEWLLLDGADPDVRNALGDTALLAAARLGRHDLVRLLLAHGADPHALSAGGCDLHCFYRHGQGSAGSRWQQRLPEINQRPVAFMVLAAMPMSLGYFVLAGVLLYRRRSLLPVTAIAVLAMLVTAIIAATLFYQCAPCVAPPGTGQFALTSILALVLSVGGWLAWHFRPYSRQF